MSPRRACLSRLVAAVAACAFASASPWATAQALPQNMVVLVPFSPGGPVDYVGRLIARKLALRSGGTAVVDNRAGANGLIAANALMHGKPDGTTLMVTGQGLFTISPHLAPPMPFDPLTTLTVVGGLAYSDTALVVNKNVPAGNMKEFVELAARSNPPLALASGGQGNITHLYIERLKAVSKANFLHVPYKGVGPAVQEVVAGQTAGLFTGLVAAMPLVKAGQLKALGVVGDKRSLLAPDVPTMAEQGYPILDVGWFALVAPPHTRPDVVQALSAATIAILAEDDTKAELARAGLNPWPKTRAEMTKIMTDESARWGQLIRDNKITVD